MTVTLSLAINMRHMLQTNNMVRKMHSTETMVAQPLSVLKKLEPDSKADAVLYKVYRLNEQSMIV